MEEKEKNNEFNDYPDDTDHGMEEDRAGNDEDEIINEEVFKDDPGKKSKKGKKDKKIEALEEKNKDIHDRFLRLYSEFDNYRKRTSKEKLELFKNASSDLIAELLPILDDFERALQSINEDKNSTETLSEGVSLIYNKLKSILKSKGLEEIDALGKEFDTDYHEAITQIPVEEPELKGKVVDVVEKGYMLNDKVLRYAKVVVGQ